MGLILKSLLVCSPKVGPKSILIPLPRFSTGFEKLTGVLTTNHDGLYQTAFQRVFGGVNLGIPFGSAAFGSVENVPPLFQLHGSFTWTFGVPIDVRRLTRDSKYHPDTIWIPPTILKESKAYPFNKLTGLAYALLVHRCDILRIVGSSLTQNDWNILSLIFNAQRHREQLNRAIFRIELIQSPEAGRRIQNESSFISGITAIEFMTEGEFSGYASEPNERDPGMSNVFAYWLKEKITYHHRRGDLGDSELAGPMSTVSGGV